MFYSRPNLSDEEFKQLSGTTLSLNGSLVINNVSGLSLTGDSGVIPIIVTGETENHVLTYKSGKIVLAESSVSGGSDLYTYNDISTCSVGGLNAGTCLYNTKVIDILQEILVPTLSPTLSPNSSTLSAIPSSTIFEVGCNVAFVVCSTYNQGCVSPVYCGGPSVRTGLPTSYNYIDIGGVLCNIPSTSLNNCTSLSLKTIVNGVNPLISNVTYSAGQYPKKSDGSNVAGSCCPAGITTPSNCINITGIYPYFWGSSSNIPVINQALINAGSKCVASSNSDVLVSNYNVVGKYIWVAIPSTSTSKTKWQGANSPSNCGTIPGDLFAAQVTCSINSPSSCWSAVSYKFYVSNYPTSVNYGMTFKNS